MKTDVANRLIWYKGKIVNVNDAMINVLAPTSQFGLNVFEGIPCYWNDDEKQLYAFRLEAHYDRLLRSARLIQINCPYTKADMKAALVEVVKANEYDENLSVRQTLFVDGFGSWGSAEPVDMFVAPIPKGRTSAEYDTCIFLNDAGKVAEGPGSCFFMVKNGTIITPKLTDSVLESITRDTIIKLAKIKGYPLVERSIDRTELYTCDEAFLCGSAMEITPILSVDGYEINNKEAGKITTDLHKTYLDVARGKIVELRDWVTAIY